MVVSNSNRSRHRELRDITIIKDKGKGFIVELVELVDVMTIKEVIFLQVSMIADNVYLDELSQCQD